MTIKPSGAASLRTRMVRINHGALMPSRAGRGRVLKINRSTRAAACSSSHSLSAR